jgi:hypothetical protein
MQYEKYGYYATSYEKAPRQWYDLFIDITTSSIILAGAADASFAISVRCILE